MTSQGFSDSPFFKVVINVCKTNYLIVDIQLREKQTGQLWCYIGPYHLSRCIHCIIQREKGEREDSSGYEHDGLRCVLREVEVGWMFKRSCIMTGWKVYGVLDTRIGLQMLYRTNRAGRTLGLCEAEIFRRRAEISWRVVCGKIHFNGSWKCQAFRRNHRPSGPVWHCGLTANLRMTGINMNETNSKTSIPFHYLQHAHSWWNHHACPFSSVCVWTDRTRRC